jgi:proteasome assembly chaperone (PAC2) family protein
MNPLVELWEVPASAEMYMIAGWRQWADAGSVSSGLPHYLIHQMQAHKIGELKSDSFYLFQFPGGHHFLRPEIKLQAGYRREFIAKSNHFYYSGDDKKGLVIFVGDEPHLNAEQYIEALLDAAEELGVKRIAAVGGVYGAMPYDKEREISCIYSLPTLKQELADYAVRLSDYEGGATIGTYLVDRAEPREIECLDFYAFVPTYDFAQSSTVFQGIRLENDFKAWYDLMRRLNYMFGLGLDLADLQHHSEELTATIAAKIEELAREMPQLKVKEYLAEVAKDFTERPFMPLDDVWARELGDLLDDIADSNV